jgi:hypothetical protein
VIFCKALGLDSNSSDEEDGPTPVVTTPSKIEKLTNTSPIVSAIKPRTLRMERSDSTIGWIKTKVCSTGSDLVLLMIWGKLDILMIVLITLCLCLQPGGIPPAAPAAVVAGTDATASSAEPTKEATTRFRTLVETLEGALFLNRPMDGLFDAVKEKVRDEKKEGGKMREEREEVEEKNVL